MKKVIRNVAIVVAVIIAVVMIMPISFVKTSDRGATHDYFPEGLKGRIKSETAGYSDEEIVKYRNIIIKMERHRSSILRSMMCRLVCTGSKET